MNAMSSLSTRAVTQEGTRRKWLEWQLVLTNSQAALETWTNSVYIPTHFAKQTKDTKSEFKLKHGHEIELT